MDSPEVALREQAAEALGFVARHNLNLAQCVIDAGASLLLLHCLREPESSLKRTAVLTLGEICKHTPELAQTIVDTGAVPYLAKMITADDPRLKVCKLDLICDLLIEFKRIV